MFTSSTINCLTSLSNTCIQYSLLKSILLLGPLIETLTKRGGKRKVRITVRTSTPEKLPLEEIAKDEYMTRKKIHAA
jgi:hypothetical protein